MQLISFSSPPKIAMVSLQLFCRGFPGLIIGGGGGGSAAILPDGGQQDGQ
jgi:hypothetical protein